MAESKWYCDACGARIDRLSRKVVAWVDGGGLLEPWPNASGLNDLRAALAAEGTEGERPRDGDEETIGTTGHLSLAATPAEESGHVHDPFLADRCGGCAALAKTASGDVEAAREALLEAVPSDWGRARVRAFEAAIRAEKSAERIALARVNGELGIALVDAEAKLAALREAVETEWYNGNVDDGARDRILAATPAEDWMALVPDDPNNRTAEFADERAATPAEEER